MTMKNTIFFLIALLWAETVFADTFSYRFNSIRLSDALTRIAEEHPSITINFIYNELDSYRTSATIDTDNAYTALRRTVGLNPISVIRKGDRYYVEALQHGKFVYRGVVTDTGGEAVAAASVMLLAPIDSAVITYGITDDEGRFTIPCDFKGVIGKVSCLGYKTAYSTFDKIEVGNIILEKHAVALDTLDVEGSNAFLYADKSVYIPTSKQKKSSQTAEDLIERMAIPQLRAGNGFKTTTGQPVDVFIDYIPAASGEVAGMLVNDVKRVGYYDYPTDPRFQGKAHVINFVMQQYRYGGYVKGIAYENFVSSRQLNGYAKFQRNKMTYDWAGGIYNKNSSRDKENSFETFRLPQTDGSVSDFERSTIMEKVRHRNDSYWTSIKALYRTEKATISNMMTGDFDRMPEKFSAGKVTYTPDDFESSDYTSRSSRRANSIVYNGYWYFILPHGNSK